MNYLKIAGILLFLIFFAYAGSFFAPDFYRKYDKPTLIFLIAMYVVFYIVDYFLQTKLSAEKLVGKDLIFLVLKFLIPISYATIMILFYVENNEDKKSFLLHFLIYAVLLMAIDTIINYQIIKKSGS